MPIIRDEHNIRRTSVIAAENISIESADRLLRHTTDGEVEQCAAGETPTFLAAESADNGSPISVIYLGRGFRAALKLSGMGSAGDKLTTGASGTIVASATAQNAPLANGDIGVALEDWVSSDDFTEVDLI